MRALLLNDTRSEGHFGCDLVIENTFRECQRAGIEIVSTVPNSTANWAERVEEESRSVEIALVNGEGTMHDDRPKAMEIAHAASRSKLMGKKVFLFNTVWQNNRALNSFLPSFDMIFCRDSLSAKALEEAGARATVVPDLIFATRVSPPRPSPNNGRWWSLTVSTGKHLSEWLGSPFSKGIDSCQCVVREEGESRGIGCCTHFFAFPKWSPRWSRKVHGECFPVQRCDLRPISRHLPGFHLWESPWRPLGPTHTNSRGYTWTLGSTNGDPGPEEGLETHQLGGDLKSARVHCRGDATHWSLRRRRAEEDLGHVRKDTALLIVVRREWPGSGAQ